MGARSGRRRRIKEKSAEIVGTPSHSYSMVQTGPNRQRLVSEPELPRKPCFLKQDVSSWPRFLQ